MWDAVLNFFANKNHSFQRKLIIGFLVLTSLIFIDGYLGFTTLYFETRKSEALSHLSDIVKDTSLNKRMRVIAEQEFYKVAYYTSWKDGIKHNCVIAVQALSQKKISQTVNYNESNPTPAYLRTLLHIISSGWIFFLIAYEVLREQSSKLKPIEKLLGALITLVITVVNAVFLLFLPAPDDLAMRFLCNAGYVTVEFIVLGGILMLFSPDFRKQVEDNKVQQ